MKQNICTIVAILSACSMSFAATNLTSNGTSGGSWSGSQLQGWTSVSTPATSGSYNAGAITNIATGAWTLWSETAQSQSRWTFGGGALSVGQSYSIDWRNNSITNGRINQMSLFRSDGTEAFAFRFLGGASNYSIKGDGGFFEEDSMSYQNTAMTLKFDLVSANTYIFTATRKSDSVVRMQTGTFTLGGTSGLGLTHFDIYNDGRTVGTSDLNINTIAVVPEPSTYALLALGALALLVRSARRRAA